ncbi:MAG: PhzF family phenazine biosynthesis protein [Deltaproteobacteria bacterium]|nr:PhzF family phenazine biosynthesis protein [Deltaproteobacteria bacterium]
MRHIPFVQLDVFTQRPLEGNQLAVFPDAGSLTGDDMQALARETNFSETTFIIPRGGDVEGRAGVRVRIFTVQQELPFAGHPTLGTAWFLHRQRKVDRVTLDLGVGPVTVEFGADGAGVMTQKDPVFGATHDRRDVAPLGGLSVDDLRDDLPVQAVSTGLPFVVVPVRTAQALRRMKLDATRTDAYLAAAEAKFLYWIALDGGGRDGVDAQARMVFYGGEDPATGSAAGCGISHLVHHGAVPSGKTITILQGLDVKRPSLVRTSAERVMDAVSRVRVGGHVVEVARGEYAVP